MIQIFRCLFFFFFPPILDVVWGFAVIAVALGPFLLTHFLSYANFFHKDVFCQEVLRGNFDTLTIMLAISHNFKHTCSASLRVHENLHGSISLEKVEKMLMEITCHSHPESVSSEDGHVSTLIDEKLWWQPDGQKQRNKVAKILFSGIGWIGQQSFNASHVLQCIDRSMNYFSCKLGLRS